jgi:putative membrane protein
MQGFFVRWLLNGISLLVVVHIVPGIRYDNWKILVVAALVLGLLNAFLKPVLVLLTLPVNILTLGIFTLFINGFIFYFTSWLLKGFSVAGYWSAFLGALVFSITGMLLGFVFRLDR